VLAAAGKAGERLAQRGVLLGRQQFLLGRRGLRVRDALSVRHVPGRLRLPRCAPGPGAFPAGGGGQPAGQRGRLAEFAQVVEELEPDGLADVVGVRAAELGPAADPPDQRGVPLDQGVPRPRVAVGRAVHQGGDPRVVAHQDQSSQCVAWSR